MPRQPRIQIRRAKRDETAIHRKEWQKRWAKYGRHIENLKNPFAEIKDPKERAAKEAELRNELMSAEQKIAQFRHEFVEKGPRPPKGMSMDDEGLSFQSQLKDKEGGLVEGMGQHAVSEELVRSQLINELPYFALHGHFSDELREGVTSSKRKKSKVDEELGGLSPGGYREAFNNLTKDEQATFRARAAEYLKYQQRLGHLKGPAQIRMSGAVTGYASDKDKQRAGHLLSEASRRALTSKERSELDKIGKRVKMKPVYEDVRPGDIPYLTEKRGSDVKTRLSRLLKDSTKTKHAKLTRSEAERRIEMAVKQELGANFETDAAKKAQDELTVAKHNLEQRYIESMTPVPEGEPHRKQKERANQQRYELAKEQHRVAVQKARELAQSPARREDRDTLIQTIKRANFGLSHEDRQELLDTTQLEMQHHYVRAMMPQAKREDRAKFEEAQKRYKAIRDSAPEALNQRMKEVLGELEHYYVKSQLPGATEGDQQAYYQAKDRFAAFKSLANGPYSDKIVKEKATKDAVKLISRLGVAAEPEFEAEKQAKQIRKLMSPEERATYERGTAGKLTKEQTQAAALGYHKWALKNMYQSPVVADLAKKLGHAPTAEDKAQAMGISVAELQKIEAPVASFYDPRTFGRHSVEDTYRRWGHADTPLFQGWLKRAQTPADSKRALAGGKGGGTGAIQWIPPALKLQWAFHSQQRRNRVRGLVSGNAAWGLHDNKPVSINKRNVDKVAFGVIPNKQYHYKLENQERKESTGERKAPHEFTVPGYDLRPLSEISPNKSKYLGRELKFSDSQLMMQPYTSPIQEDTVHYRRGLKDPKNPRHKSTTPFVSETMYVPVVGAKGQTHTGPHPKGGTEKGFFKLHATPQTASGGKAIREGSGWDEGDRGDRITKEEYDRLPKDAKRERDNVGKTIQYVFMDPADLALREKEINKASIALPGYEVDIGTDKLQRFGIPRQFTVGERVAFSNLPGQDTRRDKVIGPYFEARAQREHEEKAIQAKEFLPKFQAMFPPVGRPDLEHLEDTAAIHKKKFGLPYGPVRVPKEGSYEPTPEELKQEALSKAGFKDKGELEMLAAAAAASTFYTAQKAVKGGLLHKTFEKGSGVIERTRLYKKHEKDWSLPKFKDDITRAYIRPGDAFLLDYKDKLRHPTSAVDSQVLGSVLGVKVHTPYYRQNFIAPELREVRRLEGEAKRLDQISSAVKYAKLHQNDDGIVGAWKRHRAQYFLRHNIVKNFNIKENEAEGIASTLGESTRFAKLYTDTERKWIPAGKSPTGESIDVTPLMSAKAKNLLGHISQLETEHKNFKIPAPIPRHGMMDRISHHEFTNNEKALLIGGGIAATAVGAAYLYHRHEEKKKAEEDRVAFYNKALPPAFNVPVPHVRATGWVNTGNSAIMREIPGAANRHLPVNFGVSLDKKRVAMRPMDRHEELGTKYAPNLPLGIAGFRPGILPKGGSIAQSLTTDLQHPAKRTYKTDTHQLVVAGKKIPFTLGDQKVIKLKTTNPNRLDEKGRTDIVSAAVGSEDEEAIRRFYSYGKVDPIIETMSDPEEVNRIRKQKGKPELQKIAMSAYRRAQGPTPKQQKRDKAKMGQTGRYY